MLMANGEGKKKSSGARPELSFIPNRSTPRGGEGREGGAEEDLTIGGETETNMK